MEDRIVEDPKALALQQIKDASNVLVTVSSSPSVDQLAGAIGLTLLLNKLDKHATAVFSGTIPSTIEFLKPDETLEKTTDSLRDFIIALDKSKADKLRYKVEDKHVKVFITPYRTSLNESDLEFSHGDFNVDTVITLGVKEQKDLDAVITAHGRILHDATIVSINTTEASNLGTIIWQSKEASSLCEMLADLGIQLKNDIFDAQMATAFLTGIVAETNRFSNSKTSAATMSISAKLMSAGANQQLVATQLQGGEQPSSSKRDVGGSAGSGGGDGALDIEHANSDDADQKITADKKVDDVYDPRNLDNLDNAVKTDDKSETGTALPDRPKFVLDPPTLGGTLTANTKPAGLDPSTDPLSLPPIDGPLLAHNPPTEDGDEPEPDTKLPDVDTSGKTTEPEPKLTPPPISADNLPPVPGLTPSLPDVKEEQPSRSDPLPEPPVFEPPTRTNLQLTQPTPPPQPLSEVPSPAPLMQKTEIKPPAPEHNDTLTDLEKAVASPHLGDSTSNDNKSEASSVPDLDSIRKAVDEAASSGPDNSLSNPVTTLEASQAFNNLNQNTETPDTKSEPTEPQGDYLDINKLDEATGLPANLVPPENGLPQDNTAASVNNPTPPPPVPPPFTSPSEPGMMYGQQPLPNAENDNDAQDPMAPL